MRIFGGFGLAIAFVIWVIYRLYKKDLKQNMQAFYAYLTFVLVWAGIYSLCFLF